LGRKKRIIRKFRKAAVYPFGRVKVAIKRKLGWLGIPLILTYRGFGNDDLIYFRGRVVEDYGIPAPDPKHSIWKNMLSMFKRYKSDGLPDMEVNVQLGGTNKKAITDDEGFFEVFFSKKLPQENSNWHEITCYLEGKEVPSETIKEKKGEVMVPEPGTEFGVISDVDDTFLVSHSTDLVRKIRLMALKNAHTRLPFDGVAAFYNALSQGCSGHASNPFFFVSRSEWNLYEMLEEFCTYRNIPKGIFLLREMEHSIFKFWKSGGGNHDHKLEKISGILDTYEDLPFVLIGDSGQQDPNIYRKICLEYPERIQTIYIRDVRSGKKHDLVKEIAQQLEKVGVEMVLVEDTEQAALHAAARRLIKQDALKDIIEERDINQQLPEPFMQFVPGSDS